MTAAQGPPNIWARRSLKTISSLVHVDESESAMDPTAAGVLSPDSPPLLSAIGSEAADPPRASESVSPSGWSLVAGRSKPSPFTLAGTSDPFPPSTCEGSVIVSGQLAPRVTAYAAATSAAAENAALQFISPRPCLDCAAGPGQSSIHQFLSIVESKAAVNLLARRSIGLPRAYLHASFANTELQPLRCACIPRFVAVSFLFLG
jgi:hypothetical protein